MTKELIMIKILLSTLKTVAKAKINVCENSQHNTRHIQKELLEAEIKVIDTALDGFKESLDEGCLNMSVNGQ